MGDSYYQGDRVGRSDADLYGASWTGDELALLRDLWRRVDLSEIAERLGRTEKACLGMYYHQRARPSSEQWRPAERYVEAEQEREEAQKRAAQPVRTIHDDEDRWWEASFYRPTGCPS